MTEYRRELKHARDEKEMEIMMLETSVFLSYWDPHWEAGTRFLLSIKPCVFSLQLMTSFMSSLEKKTIKAN